MNFLRRATRAPLRPTELTFLVIVIVAVLYFTGEILKPLALAILISFALSPVNRFFERLGLPRAVAVVLTVVIVLGLGLGIGTIVGRQVVSLAEKLPDYQGNIQAKLKGFESTGEASTGERITEMVDEVTAQLEEPEKKSWLDSLAPVIKVQVVDKPSILDRLRSMTGPYLEFLGMGSFVLILVLFILVGRDDLRDRIVAVVGDTQVGLTTRTMEEISLRISRYLSTLALVNAGFGLIIGIGLSLIGLPYAVLWGCLAGTLRFIPYVGPTVAFVLPAVFSVANDPGWTKPLEVIARFGVLELILNSFLEPVIYGISTGLSALGLLVAAMFWTWLWGPLGLLLATPLTVCLVVLSKHVPCLNFLNILLGEKAELDPDVRFYQRLMALDRNGATQVVNEALQNQRRVEVIDEILIPTLARAERDSERGNLSDSEQAFIWDAVGEVVAQLRPMEDYHLASRSAGTQASEGAPRTGPKLLGIAVENRTDALVLEMLGAFLVLRPLTWRS